MILYDIVNDLICDGLFGFLISICLGESSMFIIVELRANFLGGIVLHLG